MRVWVTGASGFLGTRLCGALSDVGHDVLAPEVDLRDPAGLADTARQQPDGVVHLGALATVAECAADPATAWAVNTGGTGALLEALDQAKCTAHVVLASTAHVYAEPRRDAVIDEHAAVRPRTTYARTKRAAELVVLDAPRPATVLRLFNHTHRSQPPRYFLPHLHRALAAGGEIPVGNLDVVRDLGAVPDAIEAFVVAVSQRPQGVFNVCTGIGLSLRNVARELAARMRVEATFVTDRDRVRDEPDRVVGSRARFSAATGWEPRVRSVDTLLDAFLDEAWDG